MTGRKDVEVLRRVLSWISRKDVKFRMDLLDAMYHLKTFSADDVKEELESRGYSVGERSIRAIVGQIPTTLGILRVTVNPRKKEYELRSEYEDVLRRALEIYRGRSLSYRCLQDPLRERGDTQGEEGGKL